MKYLIDAQLPFRLKKFLVHQGFDAIHILDFDSSGKAADSAIAARASNENRVVITKDSDFIDSHLLQNKPEKLLIVSTGNISNNELIKLFSECMEVIDKQFEYNELIEMNNIEIIIH